MKSSGGNAGQCGASLRSRQRADARACLSLRELRVNEEPSVLARALERLYDSGGCGLLLDLLAHEAPEEILTGLVLLGRSYVN